MTNINDMYWEDYDGQNGEDFKYVGYTNLKGEPVILPITQQLEDMVREIRRASGSSTQIRIYR